jgi:TPR repeat protein
MRGAKIAMSRLLVGVLLLAVNGSALADIRADASRCSDAEAAYNLAITYLNRVPGQPDQAITLLSRAAIAGHAKAQEALAMQLDYGQTVPRSQIGEYIWYSIAARAVRPALLLVGSVFSCHGFIGFGEYRLESNS